MIEHDVWWPGVCRGLARDLKLYVLAANAGAELPPADMLIGSWTGGSGEWDGPGLVLPAGWAAWYAAAEELP